MVFICSGFQFTFTYAGPQAWMICMTACELACASSGPGFAACAAQCPGFCGAANALCFSPKTQITVLEKGMEINRSIDKIQPGDLVKTLVKGRESWTKVTNNIVMKGETEIIEITLQNPRNYDHPDIKLSVTPLHGVISFENGLYIIDTAEKIVIGDQMKHESGKLLQVVGVNKIKSNDGECNLATESGTVLADGVLVSTTYNNNYHREGDKWVLLQ